MASVTRQSQTLKKEHMSIAYKVNKLHLSSDSEPTLPPSTPSYPPARGMAGTHTFLGIICAIVGLLILPEIFSSASIILGAYTWRREPGNRGLAIIIFGLISMLVGIYFTAFILLDLFPS